MKRLFKMFIVLQSIALCLLLLVQLVHAQQQDLSRPQDSRKKLFLSLDEAINLALQSNLEISIEQYNPEIKREDITNAEAAFDSSVSSTGSHTLNESENAQSPEGVSSVGVGIGKEFKTGGSYELNLKSNRSAYDGSEIDDNYSTGLELILSHPLLRNRGTDVNSTQILIAQKNRDISISALRNKVIDIVSDVKNTYWKLIFALGDLEAKRLSLQLAYDLIKINEAQVNVGTLAPIEILQAKSTAASREVDIINAEKTIRDVEDELKQLLNIPETDPVWGAAIVPTDAPLSSPQPVSLEESILQALDNREDLIQLKKDLEIKELSLKSDENQLLPELNIKGTTAINGVDDELGGSVGNISDFDEVSFTLGLNFSYPIGNRAAKSKYNSTKLGIEQTKLSIQNKEQAVTVEVREAVRNVETSYKLVEATKIAQQLAEEQLDAEQKKFNEGLSTNFQVLEYQNKLTSAQSSHTQAITGYNQALVSLEKLTGTTLQRHKIVIKE